MSKFIVALGAIEIITGINDVVRITETATTYSATLPAGTYYLRGDGTSSDFCAILGTWLSNASFGGNSYTVSMTTNGTTVSWDTDPANVSAKVYVARTSGAATFKILWNDAATTFDSDSIGFVTEKGAADANPEISTLSPYACWVANDYHKDIEPHTKWVINASELASGDTSVVRRSDKIQSISLVFQWIDARRVWMRSRSSDTAATVERFIDVNNDGRPIEIHEQSLLSSSVTTLSALSSSTLVGTAWRLGDGGGDALDAKRTELGVDLYDMTLTLSGAV